MAFSRIFLVCLLAALVLVADHQTVGVEAARELLDVDIVGCKTHGFFNNKKTCVACQDNYKLINNGMGCVKVDTDKDKDKDRDIVGCKSHGFFNNKKTCVACQDNYKLINNGMECVKVSTG